MITLLITRPGRIKTAMTVYTSQEESPGDVREILAAMEGASVPFSVLSHLITELHHQERGVICQGEYRIAWDNKLEPQPEVIRNLLEQL